MPRRFPHMLGLLWDERREQQKKADDERAREAKQHALELRDERTAQLALYRHRSDSQVERNG